MLDEGTIPDDKRRSYQVVEESNENDEKKGPGERMAQLLSSEERILMHIT